MRRVHKESHLVERIGWLRAAVLGANDGIISTASLILGVASAGAPKSEVLLSGLAGLVAGAMSMAAGEYVSVSSQSDTEHADLEREKRELLDDPAFEKEELARIYAARGVELSLARKVAQQLMAKDALGAHARDELGISDISTARPVQAALASAATFSLGAAAPLVLTLLSPPASLIPAVGSVRAAISRASLKSVTRGRLLRRSEAKVYGGQERAHQGCVRLLAESGVLRRPRARSGLARSLSPS